MFCTNCGSNVNVGAARCAKCGTSVNKEAGQAGQAGSTTLGTGALAEGGQLSGRVLGGRYQLGELIGSGGMGEIYRARRTHIGDAVAVKVLRADVVSNDKTRQRFYREARAAALLHHPNVVVIHDFGEDEGGAEGQLAYIVMELLDGRSLRQVLNEEGPLDALRAYSIMRQACAALEAGHRSGVIHRDIKPDNIVLLSHDEDSDHVKILDFGIAKLRDAALDTLSAENNLTNAGTVIGTPNYMSPEQCQGEEADARSDIYALGVVLYEMLTGTMPFIAKTSTGVAIKHVTEKPRPPRELQPHLPAEVEAVVLHALEKAPDARPQSMLELARAFAAALKQAGATTALRGGQTGTKPLRPINIDTPRTDEVQATPRTLVMPQTELNDDGFKTTIAAPVVETAPQRLTSVLTPAPDDFKTVVAAEPAADQFQTVVAADEFKTEVATDQFQTVIPADQFQTVVGADQFQTVVGADQFQTVVGADQFKTEVGAPVSFDTVIAAEPVSSAAPVRDAYATMIPEAPDPKPARDAFATMIPEAPAPKPTAGGTEMIQPSTGQPSTGQPSTGQLSTGQPSTANLAQVFEGTELLSAAAPPAPVAEVKPSPKPEKKEKKKDKEKAAASAASAPVIEIPQAPVAVSATPRKKSGSQIVLLTGIAAVVLAGALAVWSFLIKDNQPSVSDKPVASPTVNTPVASAPVAPPGMTLIPGGEFKVGRADGEENERPPHTVIVAPFYIDQTEVTNEQYLKFIEAAGYMLPPSWLGRRYPGGADKLPVTDVTWADANEYAKWAKKRLPTEEEWEIAARGADGRIYPWGDAWADDLANVAKSEADKRQLAPVGTYLRGQSFYGVLDLAGNAWEWTASEYKEYAGGKPLELREGYSNLKVIRGGSYASTPKQATASYRRGWPATRRDWPENVPANYMQTGFRCAQDAPQK